MKPTAKDLATAARALGLDAAELADYAATLSGTRTPVDNVDRRAAIALAAKQLGHSTEALIKLADDLRGRR